MDIRVIVYEPGLPAKTQLVAHELATMQDLVGGYVEVVPLPVPDLVLVCNDEGLLLDLPKNRMGIRGTFLITRTHQAGDFVSLTDDDIVLVGQLFSKLDL